MTLVLHEITKRVGAHTHLDAISLTLEPGSFSVLLGRTLAGKTSLMRLMAGLDTPSSGRIEMNGVDVTHVPVQKRNVAMVYQQFINYPSLTVYDNIASPLKLARMDKPTIDRKVREVAEMLHIDALLGRLPGELSGGQQQRTAMARALVKDAELILFDEPLVNLDYKLREDLRAELRSIFRARQTIAVYATTEPGEALMLGGHTAVLHEGRLLQFGVTAQVYQQPANLAVGEVFSDPPMNHVDGKLAADALTLAGEVRMPVPAHMATLAHGAYRFGIRANHLNVAPLPAPAVCVEVRSELAEISGSETYLHVHFGGHAWVVQEEGVHEVQLGQRLNVYLDPNRLYVFDTSGALVASPRRNDQGGQ